MPIPFRMPKFDMDQEKATITSWLKKEGEQVKVDEIVLLVETDKISIEVPSPASGVLRRICAKEGETVPVTEVIAYVYQNGEKLEPPVEESRSPEVTTRRTTANFSDSIPVATPVAAHVAKDLGVDLGRIPANGKRITRADVERFAAHSREQEGRLAIPATPAARRLAHELRIDMDGLKGSGPQGRVQAEDVRKASETESIPIANQISADLLPPDMAGRPARIVPFTGMRKSIAERMEASYQQAPHISLTIDVDMTRFEEFRAQLNRLAETRHEVKISLTALLIRLTAWALEQSPYLNASLKEDQIYLWQDINIGVATALPNGLIVPVILQANSKPVHEISAILVDLTERAKQGKLSLVDVQHGTFTISNLGMFGIRQFQAIINPPESAILAVGAVKRIPVAINEQDEVAVRPMMSLTLSADHRLVDGASAARFLANLATAISTPETLLY